MWSVGVVVSLDVGVFSEGVGVVNVVEVCSVRVWVCSVRVWVWSVGMYVWI